MSTTAANIISELDLNSSFSELTEAQKLAALNSALQAVSELYNDAGKDAFAQNTLEGASVPTSTLYNFVLYKATERVCYDTLQDAINAAVSGQTVEIYKNTSETITLKDGVRLTGVGMPVITLASNGNGPTVSDNGVAITAYLENLRIVRRKISGSPANAHALSITNASTIIYASNVYCESDCGDGVVNSGKIHGLHGHTTHFEYSGQNYIAGIYNGGKAFNCRGTSTSNIGFCNGSSAYAQKCTAFTDVTADETVQNGWVAFMNYGEAVDCSGLSFADDGFVDYSTDSKSNGCWGISHRTYGKYVNGHVVGGGGISFGTRRKSNSIHYPNVIDKSISSFSGGSGSVVTITSNAHGFADGEYLALEGITGVTGGTINTIWQITGCTTNTLQLVGSTALNISGASGGTISLCNIPRGVNHVSTGYGEGISGYSQYDIGYINAGTAEGCSGLSDGDVGFQNSSGANATGCKGVTTASGFYSFDNYGNATGCTGHGISNGRGYRNASGQSLGCSGLSTANAGLAIVGGLCVKCSGYTSAAGISNLATGGKLIDCALVSTAGAGIYVTGNNVKFIGGSVLSEYNNASGSGIVLSSSPSGVSVTGTTIRTTHASAKCIETEKVSAHSIAYVGVNANSVVGTNISQAATATKDTKSNIFETAL